MAIAVPQTIRRISAKLSRQSVTQRPRRSAAVPVGKCAAGAPINSNDHPQPATCRLPTSRPPAFRSLHGIRAGDRRASRQSVRRIDRRPHIVRAGVVMGIHLERYQAQRVETRRLDDRHVICRSNRRAGDVGAGADAQIGNAVLLLARELPRSSPSDREPRAGERYCHRRQRSPRALRTAATGSRS